MTFIEIEPSFAGPGKVEENCIVISNEVSGELLRILPTGEVFAPKIELVSEAGHLFIEAIRKNLKDNPLF